MGLLRIWVWFDGMRFDGMGAEWDGIEQAGMGFNGGTIVGIGGRGGGFPEMHARVGHGSGGVEAWPGVKLLVIR